MRLILVTWLLCFSGCVIGEDVLEGLGGDFQPTTFDSSRPYEGEALIEADLELHAGQLVLGSGSPEKAYELELSYNAERFQPQVEYRREGENAVLEFELEGQGRVRRHSRKTRLDVKLSPRSQLKIRARTGAGQNLIDVSGLRLQELQLEAGVGETSLSMLSANQVICRSVVIESGVGELDVKGLGNFRFEKLDFRGGVGAATIDFSGTWENTGEVDIKVGVGEVVIRLPSDLGVDLRVKKSFLSDLELKGFRKTAEGYRSENFDQASKKIRLNVRTGVGAIEIDWI